MFYRIWSRLWSTPNLLRQHRPHFPGICITPSRLDNMPHKLHQYLGLALLDEQDLLWERSYGLVTTSLEGGRLRSPVQAQGVDEFYDTGRGARLQDISE